MASLTQKMISKMSDAIIRHRFEDDVKALERIQHGQAMEVYNLAHTPDEQAQMAKLPATFFAQRSSIRVGLLNGESVSLPLPDALPMSAEYHYGEVDLKRFKLLHSDLSMRVWSVHEAKRALRTRMDETRVEVRIALGQYRTTAQLAAGWPEVVDFIPPEPSKIKALARVPAALNELLRLPPGTLCSSTSPATPPNS